MSYASRFGAGTSDVLHEKTNLLGGTLVLSKEGKVVHCLHGLDRSFTSEGVAYELAQHNLVDFEEGIVYGKSGAGCTTATANRTSSLPRSPPRSQAARRRGDDDDDDDDDNFDDSGAESDDLSN